MIGKTLAALTVMALVTCCCDDFCENEIISSVLSPGGTFKAIVFSRGCGATVGFNTQVSILNARENLTNECGGNTLILDDTVALKITWLSETSVSISSLGSSYRFKQEERVSGIKISYE